MIGTKKDHDGKGVCEREGAIRREEDMSGVRSISLGVVLSSLITLYGAAGGSSSTCLLLLSTSPSNGADKEEEEEKDACWVGRDRSV